MFFRQQPRVPIWHCSLGVAAFWTLMLGNSLGHAQETEQRTRELIHRLVDRRFAVRNEATQALTSQGVAIIQPLVEQAIELGPEALWRTTKIIEAVGLAGDEETFVKCAAILKTISGHRQIDDLLRQMEKTWKAGQTKRSADQLRNMGAVVHLSEFPDQANAMFGEVILGAELVTADDLQPEASSESEKAIAPPGNRISPENMRAEVKKILTNSLSENYQLAFPQKEKQTRKETDLNREIFVEQQLMRRRIMFANGLAAPVDSDQTVILGKDWRGSAQDFQAISSINGIHTVGFVELELKAAYLEPLQRMNALSRLRLERITLNAELLAGLAKLRNLNALEILGLNLSNDFFSVISDFPNLSELTVEGDEAAQQVFWKHLSKLESLTGLVLKRMDIQSEHYAILEKIPSLSSVMLEGCTFEIKAFKEFKQKRPDVTFEFVPRAYMGVRADFAGNQNISPCRIGEVVAGAGADQGGMKIGDIVRRIAGQDIDAFEDLRLVVSQYKPDDVIDVEIEREGQRIPLKIKLGDRSKAIE